MDSATRAKITGANARCLSHITGKTAHLEASAHTRTYDLVSAIRTRRMRWLGHILRMPNARLVKLATRVQWDLNIEGGMFMDIPAYVGLTFAAVEALAQDRKAWKAMIIATDLS